jgi:hypothetical protein
MQNKPEYATTLKELQAVAKNYNIKFSGLKKSALKSRLTRVGICYNPETNFTRNCEGDKVKKSRKSKKSPAKSPSKSSRKSKKSPAKSPSKPSRKSTRKLSAYNIFVREYTNEEIKKGRKGGKELFKEASELWQQSKLQ